MYFYLRSVDADVADERAAARPAVGHAEHGRAAREHACRTSSRKRAAERQRPRAARGCGSSCALAFALAFLVVRGFEFAALNVRWDANAYGSIVWLLLGLHTTHLVTDTFDTAVLAVLLFTGPLEGKRFVDVSENALYWYFVVLSWLPIYAVIYLAPRFHP